MTNAITRPEFSKLQQSAHLSDYAALRRRAGDVRANLIRTWLAGGKKK